MGLDITVLAMDWEQLERTPFEERHALLENAAAPDDELDWDAQPQEGWVWQAAPHVPWCGRYEFHGTGGSYEPHFWAGQAGRLYEGTSARRRVDIWTRSCGN